MQTQKSVHHFALYAIIATLLVIVVWQFVVAQSKHNRESALVTKYRPTMQRICDDLGVKIQIHDFTDLLDAYEQITTKMQSPDQ
jgi:uncharacterized membrane protein